MNEKVLDVYPCTQDDLDNKFFEVAPSSKTSIMFVWPFMTCFDSGEDGVNLRGSATTPSQFLELAVNRCRGSNCKSKEEIDALIDKSALLYVYNTETYRPNEYGDATISKDLKVDFNPIQSTFPLL